MVCFLTAGCAQRAVETDAQATPAVQAISVQTTRPTRGDLRRETEFVGRIETGSAINVYSEITAKVLETYCNVGEFVAEGTLLMEVDDSAVKTALENAKAGLESARLTYTQTEKRLEIATEGSGYISTQMGNEKQLSDLLDSYYNTLRSKGQLDNALDEATCALWDATSQKNEAQKNAKAVMAKITSDGRPYYAQLIASSGIPATDLPYDVFIAYLTGTASAQVSALISAALQADLPLSTAINNLQFQYKVAQSGLSAAASAEGAAQAALSASEAQYESSMSTIDNSIRTVTKNYDYYSRLIGLSNTLGQEETAAMNELTLAMAELSIDNAKRGVETAEENLEKCKLYAPVSGVITAKNAVKSNFASPSVPAFVIASDEATPVVAFHVSEDGAAALYTGANVEIILNGTPYAAVVTELANATAASGLYAAKAAITDPAKIERTGSVVKVRAATAEALGVLTLPLDLIEYEGNTPYVYVYENGFARRRDLTLGMSTGDAAEITGGLTATDEVITTWHPDLKNGAAVFCEALSPTVPTAPPSIEVIE